MATTSIGTNSGNDAVVIPQAQGTGLASEDDTVDAAGEALLPEYSGVDYHTLTVSSRDGTNDTITFNSGIAYITDDSTSTSNSRGSGGNAQIQSTSSSGYDTEIPTNQVYCVVIPSTNSIDVADSQTSQVWVNITDVTSNNAVEFRSDGGGGTTSEPSDTFLKLGDFNPDDSSQDVLTNAHNPGTGDEFVSETSVTDASQLDATDIFDNTYDTYEIELQNLTPVASSSTDFLELRFFDASGTIINGSSDYSWVATSTTSSGVNSGSTTSGGRIGLVGGGQKVGSDGTGLSGTVVIHDARDSGTRTRSVTDTGHEDNSDQQYHVRGSAVQTTATEVTGIRLSYESNNITGSLVVEGRVNDA